MRAAVMQKGKARNVSLDLVKLIAAFAVICIHYMFSGQWGVQIKAVARFAVPFFFMVSGFYSYNDNSGTLLKKAWNIVKIYLWSFLLYFVYGAVREMAYGNSSGILDYIGTYFKPKTIFDFLLHNTTISAVHLWFLPALTYCYLLYLLVKKAKISDRILFVGAGVLLLVRLFAGELLGALGNPADLDFFPNFLFIGFPFFVFGIATKKYITKCNRLPMGLLWALIAVGVLETVLSTHFFAPQIIYAGSGLIALPIFLIAARCGDKEYSKAVTSLSGLSAYIYVFHVAVGGTMEILVQKLFSLGASPLWINIKPIVVLLLTAVLSLIYQQLLCHLKNAKTKKTA